MGGVNSPASAFFIAAVVLAMFFQLSLAIGAIKHGIEAAIKRDGENRIWIGRFSESKQWVDCTLHFRKLACQRKCINVRSRLADDAE